MKHAPRHAATHLHRAGHLTHLTHLIIPPALLRQVQRGGPLESPWVAAGLGVLLTASVLLVVVRHRRRARSTGPGVRASPASRPRRPWQARAAMTAWLTALSILTVLTGLNAYVGYVPTLPAVLGDVPMSGGAGSQVWRLTIGAPALDIPPSPTYVYLPPGYDDPANATRRYPVVYLLHGYPGGPLDWFRAAMVQQVMDAMLADHLVQPMIVVAPDASGGWLHDSEMLNQVGGPQVETYLTSTVIQAVDARYRTVADRDGRAIGGMSSGGYGALNLGLHHQNLYSVILSEMPYGDPGRDALRLLGGNRALWAANAPDHYLPTMTFHHQMAVDLLSGPFDSQRGEAARLAKVLRGRGQPATYTQVLGAGHTWRGARRELPYALTFASQHLRGEPPHRIPLAAVSQPMPASASRPRR
jgi:enterochelin esterase-like enzyme